MRIQCSQRELFRQLLNLAVNLQRTENCEAIAEQQILHKKRKTSTDNGRNIPAWRGFDSLPPNDVEEGVVFMKQVGQ